ncbi:hypothetical protein DS832_08895 [Bombilactobacillus bombi]|uniref:DNA-directed RNA polymerase beta subunit n=1 Tax=Bombilactobacillus bombi TaxID=1303590 RepID=A0A417Z367_9LACO|nr:hypothetical protein [Bombilactobacillus bombi]RHW44620.1 hypothetical protein DS832_08895 [Bombilactobacillus bombi]
MTNSKFDQHLVQKFLTEYQDRGMLKWQGFYLSDHTSKLNQLHKHDHEVWQRQHSEQMAAKEIVEVIDEAVTKNLEVIIEPAILDKDLFVTPFIQGKIAGYYQDNLVIGKHLMKLNEIYAIKILKQKKSKI